MSGTDGVAGPRVVLVTGGSRGIGLACAKAFEHSAMRWRRRIEEAVEPALARAAIVDAYLSESSRDAPGLACPASALVSDAAREPVAAPLRQSYLEGLKRLLGELDRVQPGAAPEQADDGVPDAVRRQSLVDMALMVGAQLLARATQGDALSEQVLAAARQQLLQRPSHPAIDRQATRCGSPAGASDLQPSVAQAD